MAVAKTFPPIAVSGLTLAGVQLQDWLIMATLLYTVIQIIIALPKLKQSFKSGAINEIFASLYYNLICFVSFLLLYFFY